MVTTAEFPARSPDEKEDLAPSLFPQPNLVTSDLALHKKKADHRQGVSGTGISREKARKFFVVKILTSNPYALKILRTIFANPAPAMMSYPSAARL